MSVLNLFLLEIFRFVFVIYCLIINVLFLLRSLATAHLDYHIFIRLSRTFFKFFQFVFWTVLLSRDSSFRLSYLGCSVNNFFHFFKFFSEALLPCSATSHILSQGFKSVNTFFHFFLNNLNIQNNHKKTNDSFSKIVCFFPNGDFRIWTEDYRPNLLDKIAANVFIKTPKN